MRFANGASELYLFVVPCAQIPVIFMEFSEKKWYTECMLPKRGILLQSYTEMIKVPVFLTGHGCVYENKKEN